MIFLSMTVNQDRMTPTIACRLKLVALEDARAKKMKKDKNLMKDFDYVGKIINPGQLKTYILLFGSCTMEVNINLSIMKIVHTFIVESVRI